ncbi:lysine-specific demethylase 3A [Tribolium madens]|uniref:lysine-specific demethylase 3A n=1 Tax=Tribolium madens TaxID=41895 RepID=UPI001CF74CEB|nr:lysine-specific demethylase 3A [Tribolium madens]
MAYKCREEIVGKRFLSVSGFTKLKVGKISEWGWRAGVIRAATHKDNNHPELQILVEYDDVEWHRREWISVYKDKLFHLFMVEQGLAWVKRRDPFAPSSTTTVLWPALTFSPLVSAVDVMLQQQQPVEFLLDKELAFEDYKLLKPFQEWDSSLAGVREYPELKAAVRRWAEQQDGQRILLTTPSVLVGYRVEVYRAEGTTQWYTAVIVGYNEATRDLTVTDDTVLEEHNEDPALVQMRLIGDGVVESIMRGENVGITPRRSRSAVLQTQYQQQPSRVVRGLSVTSTSSVNGRKHHQRSGKSTFDVASSVGGTSPEPLDKGSKTRKRKPSETRPNFGGIKEDLENNKQSRKRNVSSKKKVLEEVNNSKLREVEIRVEDCLLKSSSTVECSDLDDTSNGSSVQLVPVEVVPEDEDSSVRVATSSMPVSGAVTEVVSEEDDCVIVAHQRTRVKISGRECSSRGDDDGPLSSSSPFSRMELSDSANALRFPDDRSDSGVSSLRSSSGDERSGSRSSALSSSDEPQNTSTSTNRSPLFIPAQGHHHTATEPVRVWRDPNLLLESEPHVRHIHSVQHQSLLMSHPSTPAVSGPPPTSNTTATHPAALFPPVPPPPTLMTPHPLPHHPHLAPATLYPHPHHLDILWKQQRYAPLGAHLLTQPGAHPTEEMLERERERAALIRERQNQEVRELEKQKEKERLERERQEREKAERDREKQERDREEKERQEQALKNHFEKSLRQAQKRDHWNPIGGRPPQPRPNSEDERKRVEQEIHQRGDTRHLAVRSERDHRAYYTTGQRPPSVPTKTEYPPPPAHSRVPTSKPSEKIPTMHSSQLQKGEVNVFGYPVYSPLFSPHEPKTKSDHHKSQSLVVSKSTMDSREVLSNPPPLMSEMKNSVIVKHEGKNSHHLEPRVSIAHSPSPKLIGTHYLTANQPKGNLYEYRSPVQSPHHLSHTPSPHHNLEPQNLGKTSHHRQSNQLPSPHHQRQSPHHPQQHPSPELRYRESQMIYPTGGKGNYYLSNTTSAYSLSASVSSVSNSKPKVSSPAPHHIYGKPGPPTGPPVTRHEPSTPIQLTAKPPLSSSVSPSPYQQMSQYHPPHPQNPPTLTCPPPAHSRYPVKTSSRNSPPTAASAPRYIPTVQTQPLDLGVSKYDPSVSPKRKATPVCLETKKRRIEPQTPQLARVSEPSPLIASAATTITTVVNTAAYQTPPITSNDSCDISVTVETVRPSSVEANQPTSNSPAPNPPTNQPEMEQNTPVKLTIAPSCLDSEKSNSPGPTKSSTYPVRHLKKAWLQRHTGEDLEDTTGVTGSGSCVTLPIINMASNNKENPVHSIHSIGSMAVNSINKTKHFAPKPNNRKTPSKEPLNGDTTKADDSSSSDQDRGRKSPPKRKPPKVKRKKGPVKKPPLEEKKRKPGGQSVVVSESGSDSEKESGSEKDSDSGASTKKSLSGGNKEPRKRGRRPKSSKNDKGEEPRVKKSKDETVPQRDPFRKPPVGQLKKTGESFLQDGPCFEVAPKLAKCRECRWTPNQRSKNMPNIFCRFYAFRRLRYTKNGQLAIAGFSDPHKDALEDDLRLWLPNPEAPPQDLDLETSRFILKQVGDHFCDLFVQEKEAHAEYVSDDKTVAWKRVVQGVREMCDVCETTLFNFHWACGKCGFVVCLDCYKSRKNGSIKVWGEPGKDRDEFSWLLCTNRQAHEQEKLMLTQIIAGDSLSQLGKKVHEMRELWNIEQYCACPASKEVVQKPNNVAYKEIVKKILLESKVNGIKKEIKEEGDVKVAPNGVVIKDEKTSPLSWLADVALSNEDKKNDDNSTSDSDEGSFSTLRELLIRPSHKPNGSRAGSPVSQKNNKKVNKIDTLDEVISSVIEDSVPKVTEVTSDVKPELKHFLRRYNWQAKGRAPLPIRIMTLTESKMLYPDVPHSWLCDGKLLRLSDSTHKDNYKIFQDQWKRGQPVIVSDVTKNLNKDLWNPDAFARDFGDEKNDLINCMTGNLVPNQPMRKFWEGFDHFSKRLKDDRGNPMLLKLKDWPPGEDFAEMLPSRFSDLMKVLPLSEYTHRTGRLNLASRLPDCFVRPDLGPKMYNAYGSALHPSKGTTNLHLDISDAVNVMVYVGIPKDGDSDEHIKEAFRAIDEAGCDILTRRRVRDKGELPGALWHIYNARDADKIRDLLNKVVVEKGGRLEPHHDPIHDQSCYLDGPLRERLYKEYGVEGYAIVQCLGDAVFIPAGAPHQVRNLHNCIKVAEDFVSPENVSHCFHLTQEFRDLSDTHTNHEDKLQIKNIIYHAVKDALSCISAVLNKHMCKKEDELERNGEGEAAESQTEETA